LNQTPDYKSTIRLPQTDFPMKGNLPVREPEIIKFWESQNIYEKVLAKNSSGKTFTLPDGPPYANGSIHIGHALNKILKDIILKYKSMQGFRAPFIPGWDCHGLPIEHKVMKDLADKKQVKTDQEILALCRQEAWKWVEHQREQFKRLGVLGDWNNPYITMSKEYEAEEVREFARAFEKNLIYRGEKPVYWDWTIQTALADAEVEYHDHKSPAIYVKFNLTETTALKKILAEDKPASLVIWTTTPWTLPANLGVCLNQDFDYGVFEWQDELLVIAAALQPAFEKDTGFSIKLRSTFKGSVLEHSNVRHPWIDRNSLIMLGEHVTQHDK
jgi:isoleucyl-tRNA synthetase